MSTDRPPPGNPRIADLRESKAFAGAGLLGFAVGFALWFGLGFSLGPPLSGTLILVITVAALAVASLVGAAFYNWRMKSIRSSNAKLPAAAPIPSASQSMDQAVVDTLAHLIARDGTGFLDDTRRWESLLRENCPHAPLEIAALAGALRLRIPQRLRTADAAGFGETSVENYASQLNAERGLDLAAARWAVRAWGTALGLPAN